MRHNVSRTNAFIFSILTALGMGLGVGFAVVLVFQTAFNSLEGKVSSKALLAETTPPVVAQDSSDSDEEGEEDPAVINDLSHVLSPELSEPNINGREVIESARASLPKSQLKPISALSYSVTDMDSGDILTQKNTDESLPLASITKLVTAVVSQKIMPADSRIKITSKELSVDGNTGHLRLGETFTPDELLYPMLMVSSNDAAEAFSESYGRTQFIAKMNEWVKSIGATHTHFDDASGLSPKNVSTAHDISVIVEWIQINMPEIFAITSTKTKTIRTHTWVNPTHFLNLSAYIGGKDGYTPEAKETGIALFQLGSPAHLYSVVLLGSLQRDGDTLAILEKALK